MLLINQKIKKLINSLALLGAVIGVITAVGLTILRQKNADGNFIAETTLMVILNISVVIFARWKMNPILVTSIWAGIGMAQALVIFFFFNEFRIYLFPQTLLLLTAAFIGLLTNLLTEKEPEGRSNMRLTRGRQLSLGNHPDADLLAELTLRERQILILIARGYSNQEIAQELVISQNTVRHHVHGILTKLGCSSRSKAAALAIRAGFVGGEIEN